MHHSDPFSSTLRPGQRLGRFRVVERLGAGGMATVYRAEDEQGLVVALKVMEPGAFEHEDLARFRREYRALANLSHPNIVRVLEAGTTDARAWLALEYVDGTDLETQIARWREEDVPDRFERAEQITRGLLHGLQYVHDHGLIHRDLKPANILLTATGQPKLSDFGVVKAAESSQITMAGRLVGTIAYMAPELIADEPIDARTDLYGLGAVLYTLLALERPIEADTLAGYLAQHLTYRPPPPHEIDPSVPNHLERICLRLLEKDPARRYPSARAVLEALDARGEEASRFLHGREPLLTAWSRKLDNLARGRGGLVFVAGPDGSGRSSLLRQLAEQARAEGRSVAELTDEDPSAQAQVLWVDDLADRNAAVVRRLQHLARALLEPNPPPLLVVAGGGPDAARGLLGRAPTDDVVTVLQLEPLDARQITALLRDRGMPTPPATTLGQRLGGSSAAQPGVLHDLVDAMLAEEWLVPTSRGLRSTHRLSDYRNGDLPMSERQRALLAGQLQHLEPDARDLLELLALLGQPGGAAMLARAAGSTPRLPELIDGLVREGLLTVREDEDDRTLALANPGVASILKAQLPEDRRRAHHLTLAHALRRSRRNATVTEDRAYHLAGAGLPDQAWPLWIRAAQQAMRERRFQDTLRLLDEADESLRRSGLDEVPEHQLTSASARGGALLAIGQWSQAERSLQQAVASARQLGDRQALTVNLAELGRARYHLGHRAEARTLLEEAMAGGAPDDLHLARAACTLADIHLRLGELDRARTYLDDALATAMRQGARDAEARARRGLAHVHGLRGDLVMAAAELEQAEELLLPNGSAWVRVGVLIRSVELDLAAGRLGAAGLHGEQLTDLASAEESAPQLPLALALTATVHQQLGRIREAGDLARRAITVGEHQTRLSWQGRLVACRVLLAEGDPIEAALERVEVTEVSGLHNPKGQLLALRARAIARRSPDRARELIASALDRPRAAWVLSHWYLVRDVAHALGDLGDNEAALHLIANTLPLIDARRADGVLLDAALLRHRLGAPEAARELSMLAGRVATSVSARHRATFRRRPDLLRFLTDHDGP
jgi:tetratricopeptide (TPR) repeat protein/tRNA A-37 threonylcarbamoyl transferase component Bud32